MHGYFVRLLSFVALAGPFCCGKPVVDQMKIKKT
jgi:hypothetical protein